MAYLDAASGLPLHPAARDVLLAAHDGGWADPARLHSAGRRSRALLDQSRAVVAAAVGARPDEITFTSSGTRANHLAVAGAVRAASLRGDRAVVVHSAVEHSSVLAAASWHAREDGAQTRVVGVDRDGVVDLAELDAALPGATLACVQSASHEVGTVQPIADVARRCADTGVPLLVDAAQSVGRAPVPGGWSLLTASARKWGGPPGVGVLAVRTGAPWRASAPADERESGREPGTPNVPGIVAAAAALEAVGREAAAEAVRLTGLVDRIRERVPVLVPDVEVVGHPVDRLPHLVTFSLLYVDGEAIVTELDRLGFAVSSGSSCTASTLEPSHVLVAMGVLSHGNVRVSLSRDTTSGDVDRFLTVLPEVVARLRADAGVTGL